MIPKHHHNDVLADIAKLVQILYQDRDRKPPLMYYADSVIRALGCDPEDYPELKEYPGVRVVELE